MSDKITVEDCRKLLKGEVKDDKLATALFNAINSLPVGEQFAFAMALARELSFYYELSFQPRSQHDKVEGSFFQSLILNSLLRSFEVYTEISHEEYAILLAGNDLYGVVLHSIKNDLFPIDFLAEDSWLEKYINHPMYWFLEGYARGRRDSRSFEIMAYYRNMVPNSEHMSDEMVLSVAGI